MKILKNPTPVFLRYAFGMPSSATRYSATVENGSYAPNLLFKHAKKRIMSLQIKTKWAFCDLLTYTLLAFWILFATFALTI